MVVVSDKSGRRSVGSVVAVVDGEGVWERLNGGRSECGGGCDQGSRKEVGARTAALRN